ncbi:uncharacterized protein LOC141698359 [Apium graveolens]|uniref:uncharacterized protein LOC141698359 n=1 Tax=Apium graveolens TaxID=4045 RepID=UPI003D7B6E36
MESSKLASVLAICFMVLAVCSSVGVTAAGEDVGAPAPSPTSAGVQLFVPAALAAVVSLFACLV